MPISDFDSSILPQGEYSEDLSGSPEAGMKVLAHHQSEPPLIEALGDALPPGFHAFIGIRKYEVRTCNKISKCSK